MQNVIWKIEGARGEYNPVLLLPAAAFLQRREGTEKM